jgi:hypothetical protein
MSDIVYRTLEESVARMPDDIGKAVDGFKLELFDEMLSFAFEGERKRAPTRTGFLADSLVTEKQDRRYVAGFTDPKATSLDKGRRKSKPFSRKVHATSGKRGRRGALLGAAGTALYRRTLGSEQDGAKRGMTVPTGFAMRAAWPSILTTTAQAVGSEPDNG